MLFPSFGPTSNGMNCWQPGTRARALLKHLGAKGKIEETKPGQNDDEPCADLFRQPAAGRQVAQHLNNQGRGQSVRVARAAGCERAIGGTSCAPTETPASGMRDDPPTTAAIIALFAAALLACSKPICAPAWRVWMSCRNPFSSRRTRHCPRDRRPKLPLCSL